MSFPWLLRYMTKTSLFFHGSRWDAFSSADVESSPVWCLWSLTSLDCELDKVWNQWRALPREEPVRIFPERINCGEGRNSLSECNSTYQWEAHEKDSVACLSACLPLLLAGKCVCPCCHCHHCCGNTFLWLQTPAFFQLPVIIQDRQLSRTFLASQLHGPLGVRFSMSPECRWRRSNTSDLIVRGILAYSMESHLISFLPVPLMSPAWCHVTIMTAF